ncbi:MAG: hypothetical protein JM58_04005 [Peptococcaceae bacterium BICA1-8]|nr:MAG: hypothetical protein JM58_04005 [Peptococcaceae bacterium BICA1-8]
MDNSEETNGIDTIPKKKFSVKYIISAVIILVLSFAITFVVGKALFNAPDASADQVMEIGPLYNSPEFTVNIANSGGRRFLMTQFSLEVENKKVLKELNNKLPVFKDKVIIVLSDQTVEDLDSLEGKEEVKKQLMDNINIILTEGKVKNIFFNKFVYQ